MATIDLSQYPTGTELKVSCRDGIERTVVVKAFGPDYNGNYPHQLNNPEGSYEDSLTNRGTVYTTGNADGDVVRILSDEGPATKPHPVARGYRRSDMMPSAEHGSKDQGQILWRDSNDNELILCDVSTVPALCYDQWFPLAQLDFQVQEISESLKAHREAAEAYKGQPSEVTPMSFTRGYLANKGVTYSEDDFKIAFSGK